jgi:hypothetical protein
MHFDGNLADEAGNYTASGSPVYADGKWKNGIDTGPRASNISFGANAFDNILLNNFTVEMWIKVTVYEHSNFMLAGNSGYAAAVRMMCGPGSVGVYLGYIDGGSAYSIVKADLDPSKFHHAAAVRNGGTFMLFVDGILAGTVAYNPASLSNRPINGTCSINADVAYIDELRISDVARWTSNFEPPKYPYKIR